MSQGTFASLDKTDDECPTNLYDYYVSSHTIPIDEQTLMQIKLNSSQNTPSSNLLIKLNVDFLDV